MNRNPIGSRFEDFDDGRWPNFVRESKEPKFHANPHTHYAIEVV